MSNETLESVQAEETAPVQQENPNPGSESETKDLTTDPNFRKFQSTLDKKIQTLDEQVRQYQALVEQERQRRLVLEQQLREAKLADMDEFERIQFEREEAVRIAQEYAQYTEELQKQLQQYEAMNYRQQRIQELSNQYGVPVDKIDTSSEEAALESVLKYVASVRRANNREGTVVTDTGGGGTTSTTEDILRQEYQKALQNNDPIALLKTKMKASREGIQL